MIVPKQNIEWRSGPAQGGKLPDGELIVFAVWLIDDSRDEWSIEIAYVEDDIIRRCCGFGTKHEEIERIEWWLPVSELEQSLPPLTAAQQRRRSATECDADLMDDDALF